MKLSQFAKAPDEQKYPEDWPARDYYVHESDMAIDVFKGFKELVEASAGERALDSYIIKAPHHSHCGIGHEKHRASRRLGCAQEGTSLQDLERCSGTHTGLLGGRTELLRNNVVRS